MIKYLTLTRVVFEYPSASSMIATIRNLTLTRVVFELY